MAVPKKRTSKTKKNIRKTNWKRKAAKSSLKAYSLAVVALNQLEKKVDKAPPRGYEKETRKASN